MKYSLLWIGILISSLLWSAMWLALGYRCRGRWARVACGLIAMIPLAKLGAASAAAGFLRFGLEMQTNWFNYFGSLLLATLLGSVALIVLARRRRPVSSDPAAIAWPAGWLALGMVVASTAAVLIFANIDENVRARFDAMLKESANPIKEDGRGKFRRAGLFTAILAPNVSRVFDVSAQGQATHANCEVAIAMTRYRLDHGHYPERLDALVPAYLTEIPIDPFDGKPLRLVHKGSEWTIYSIGPDRTDDGGTPMDNALKLGDITFILRNAKRTASKK